jgi:Heterokaryon incompatibility protein (HET)
MPFIYSLLDRAKREIRLVRLLPRKQDGVKRSNAIIQCSIEHLSLDDLPIYTALSYVWGDATRTKPILVGETILQVTENLECALREFQPEPGQASLDLWIDAISINQKDNAEKSSQVQMMRTIFENAQQVLVWLGPAADDSDRAFEKLEIIGKEASTYRAVRSYECRFYLWKWMSTKYTEDDLDPIIDAEMQQILSKVSSSNDSIDGATFLMTATQALLRRSWWQRVWVLQEVTVAKEAIFACGSKRLSAEYLSAALTVLRVHHRVVLGALQTVPDDFVPSSLDSRPYIMMSYRITPKNCFLPLAALLRGTCDYTSSDRRLCASDPRDYIYAMLGICTDAEELGIVPDYSKSCSDVFSEIAKAFDRRYKARFLALCYFPKRLEDLPSWVPDWSATSQGRSVGVRLGHTREHGPDKLIAVVQPPFSATKGLATSSNLCDDARDPRKLLLHGIRIDIITATLSDETIQQFARDFDILREDGAVDYDSCLNKLYNPEISMPSMAPKIEFHLQEKTADGRLVMYPPSNVSLNLMQQVMAASLYVAYLKIDPSSWQTIAKLGVNFLTSVRELVCSGGNIYETAELREDAVWRTPIADQECGDRDEWFRPASLPDLFQLLYDNCTGENAPEGLGGLADNARIHRAYEIINSWEIFHDFKIETVQNIFHNRNDPQPMDIALRSEEEVAIAMFRQSLLDDFGFRSEEEVKEAAARHFLDPKDVSIRVFTHMHSAFNPYLNEMICATYNYLKYARYQLLGRKIFVTSQGYLGLGPQHLQTGDVVALFEGADLPYVLRTRNNGGFELVGESYVHGIMNGEFIEKGVDTELFELF